MAIVGSDIVKNENSSSVICVDSYNNGEMKGKLYNSSLPEPLIIENIIGFLKNMERLFESAHTPQATMQQRTFFETTRKVEPFSEFSPWLTRIPEERGKLATFRIRVIFRQNASWQGTVYWLDQEKEERFRSVLELILLLDDTLQIVQGKS